MKRSRNLVAALPVLLWLSGFAGADPKYPPFLEDGADYRPPTDSQKQWAMATCAVLAEFNGCRHDLLGGCERTAKEITAWQESLAKWWGVENREDLLGTLAGLEEGGHRQEFDAMARGLATASPETLANIRQQAATNPSVSNKVEVVLKYKDQFGAKSLTSWDFARYVSLCGWGYIAGYLTEEEAWRRIMPTARLLQKTFTSWADLGTNYVVGCEFWSLRFFQQNGVQTRQCLEKLKTDPKSPWQTLDWKTDLSIPQESQTPTPPLDAPR